jgi:hypothetical protein
MQLPTGEFITCNNTYIEQINIEKKNLKKNLLQCAKYYYYCYSVLSEEEGEKQTRIIRPNPGLGNGMSVSQATLIIRWPMLGS